MTKRELVKQELTNCSNFKEISKKCKVSQWLVSNVAKEIGVFNKISRVKELEIEMENLFKQGYNITEIGKKLNIWYHTVGKILKKKGYSYSSCGKTKINSNTFNIIDSEESAYWLGFFYADGCVSSSNRIEIGLKQSDYLHLEKLKNYLKWEGDIEYRSESKSYRIMFKDGIIGNDLKRLGCVPKKSLILEFPTEDQVPNNLIHHFVRGYFDGDGYISDPDLKPINVQLLGTFNFLQKFCKIYNLSEKSIKMRSNIHYVSVSGEKAIQIMNMLYKDCNIFLERKKKRFDSYVNRKNDK